MTPKAIHIIAEGQGEASRPASGGDPAAVVLAARVLSHFESWELHVCPRVFRLGSYGSFFYGDRLERAIVYSQQHPDCAAIAVLLDMDDDCPAEKGPALSARIAQMPTRSVPVAVVCAKCEFEAWFLASLTSIRGASYPGDPEARRDAKGWLRAQFDYRQTRDQAAYARQIDIATAERQSRSFRRLIHALHELVEAHRAGVITVTPPPKPCSLPF